MIPNDSSASEPTVAGGQIVHRAAATQQYYPPAWSAPEGRIPPAALLAVVRMQISVRLDSDARTIELGKSAYQSATRTSQPSRCEKNRLDRAGVKSGQQTISAGGVWAAIASGPRSRTCRTCRTCGTCGTLSRTRSGGCSSSRASRAAPPFPGTARRCVRTVGHVGGRSTAARDGRDVRALADQIQDDVVVAAGGGMVQRRVAVVVAGVDVGAQLLDEAFHRRSTRHPGRGDGRCRQSLHCILDAGGGMERRGAGTAACGIGGAV